MAQTWSCIGPFQVEGMSNKVLPCGGRIDSIAFSPNFNGAGISAMFLATPGGGVWRSSNFTSESPFWLPVTDHLPGVAENQRVGINVMTSVAVDPDRPNIIYAGPSCSPACLLKSSNGGNTWSLIGQNMFGNAAGIQHVLVEPIGTIYVAFGSGGFWSSSDGGTTWTDITPAGLSDVEFHDAVFFWGINEPPTVYVAVVDRQRKGRGGIWSIVNGQWTQMPMNLTNMRKQAFSADVINRITMSVDSTLGPCASLSQADDGQNKVGLLNVFKLRNGTWEPQWFSNTNWFISQGGYVQGVCIAPDARIYAGGIGLAQQVGSSNFVDIVTDSKGNRIHVDVHVVAAYQGKIYVGTDGGLFRCTPKQTLGVDAWESLNSPSLMNFLSTGASAHPTDPSVVLVGNQDNGIARRSALGSWSYSGFSNEREKLRFDPSLSGQGKYAFSGDPDNGFFESQDGGISFNGFEPKGVPAPDPPPPFTIHPKNPARILVGWMNVYETPDRGQNWKVILALQSAPTAVAYDRNRGIYVGAGSILMQSFDDGTNWSADGFKFGDSINSICPDPATGEAIYVATGTRVFRRSTRQSQWEDLTGNLNLGVNVLTLLPQSEFVDPWLFVGTPVGIYFTSSLDGNNTWWARFGSGFPDSNVNDLELHTTNRLLLAATWGRGAWATVLDAKPEGISIVPDRDNCGVFAVEGGGARFFVETANLTPPIVIKWVATTNIIGADAAQSVTVEVPPVGGTATVTVTVTDAEGGVFESSYSFGATPERAAQLIELLCHIRKFPNFPIDPLSDPPRDFPTRLITRAELLKLQDIATQLSDTIQLLLRDGH